MNKNIQYCFLGEKTSRLKTVKIFLFFVLLPYHMFFYTMDLSHDELFDRIIKTEGKKTDESLSIPRSIDNIEQLKKRISNDCQCYSNQINKIRKDALDYFQQYCGLNTENWKKFIQEIDKIPAHTNYFTPPPFSFQQSIITPNITLAPLKSLANNCIKNGVCFSKMHVRQSSEISDFCLHTPFYASLQNPNGFTFLPDELKLNAIQYSHNPHFFNICIIAALKEDIARLHHLFDLAYQYQLGLFRHDEYIPYFECTQLHQGINSPLTFFILNRLRTAILHLILRHKGAAEIVNNCLTTHPEICNRYGITEEDLPFLEAMIHIDSLKLYILQSEKLKENKSEDLEKISNDSHNDPFETTESLIEPHNSLYDTDDILCSFFND